MRKVSRCQGLRMYIEVEGVPMSIDEVARGVVVDVALFFKHMCGNSVRRCGMLPNQNVCI